MSFINAQAGNILGLVGKGVEGVGQLIGARQEIETGEFNATVLKERSQAERSSQVLLEEQKRRILKNRIGTQISLFAKSGVKLTGSPIDVLTDSIANAEMDIAIDRFNSEVAARGFETEAEIERFTARQKATTARFKAGRSFLSTAVDLINSRQKIGSKGQKLGAGTTSRGIKVPSRFIPSR